MRIRCPVESMLGEALSAVDVTERGLAHDSRCAPTDRDTGKVASATHPRSLTDTPPHEATLGRADPEDVRGDASEPLVSAREGRLGGGSPEGTFFDCAPVHLLTTSTVAQTGSPRWSRRGRSRAQASTPRCCGRGRSGSATRSAGPDTRNPFDCSVSHYHW
ncbi:hypothetical protein ACIOHS_42820 [Streptomyces sp. NPDC088253]|uniref:hypothetical protein n=1 Tax=Streptomyces sp. NPDC088253 TaxID=3365846 RepID=UPI003823A38F